MALCRCFGCMEIFDDEIGGDICPYCGYIQSQGREEPFHLEPGTMLGEGKYTIGRALGTGGFAITYLAWDNGLKKKIAIKELYPGSIASRAASSKSVVPFEDEMMEYQYGVYINDFIEEARNLVKLQETSGIVHVFDSVIENNTAYIVMDYISGRTLKDIQRERNAPIDYREVVNWVVPVLESLDEVHKANVVHRDISPDNIMYNENRVKLIDFGSARNYNSSSAPIQLKRGYAPEEQYDENGNLGPWTDIYAMAATIYHLVTGRIPPESIERRKNDTILLPSEFGIEIDQRTENAIMKALSIDIENRFGSAKEFADAIKIDPEPEPEPPKIVPKWLIALIAVVAVVVIGVVAVVIGTLSSSQKLVNVGVGFDQNAESMPDFTGSSYYEAYDYLTSLGWNVSFERSENTADFESDSVIKQSVPEGSILSDFGSDEKVMHFTIASQSNDDVNDYLVVSKWVLMPSVTKLSRASAENILEKYGLTNVEFVEEESSQNEGTVLRQSVKKDTVTEKTDRVVITVAVAPATQAPVTQAPTQKPTVTQKPTETEVDVFVPPVEEEDNDTWIEPEPETNKPQVEEVEPEENGDSGEVFFE